MLKIKVLSVLSLVVNGEIHKEPNKARRGITGVKRGHFSKNASGRASHIGGKSCYTYKIGKIHDLITLKGYSLKTMDSRSIKVYII